MMLLQWNEKSAQIFYKSIKLLSLFLLIQSCKPEPEPIKPSLANLVLKVENKWSIQPFKLYTESYLNANQDTCTFSRFKFYISNIKLTGPNASYVQPYSYFLVDAENPQSLTLNIPDVPEGLYNQISFGLGVDSISNHSGPQTGALNTSNNMFWLWSDGYVFWKLEGNYRSPVENGALTFHIGHDKNYKTFTKNLPTKFNAQLGSTKQYTLKCQVDEFFKNPRTILFSDVNNVMGGAWTDTLANNSVDVFEITN